MFVIQWTGQQYVKFKGPLRVELPRPLKLLYEKQQRWRTGRDSVTSRVYRSCLFARQRFPSRLVKRLSLSLSFFLSPPSLTLSFSIFFSFFPFPTTLETSARNTNDFFCPHSSHLFRDAVSVVFFNFYIFAHYLSLFHSLFFYCYYYYCTSCRFLGILLFPFPLFPFF